MPQLPTTEGAIRRKLSSNDDKISNLLDKVRELKRDNVILKQRLGWSGATTAAGIIDAKIKSTKKSRGKKKPLVARLPKGGTITAAEIMSGKKPARKKVR